VHEGYREWYPRVSGSNVAWYADDGNDDEIVLYWPPPRELVQAM
jgi:hypothetical protein